MNDAVSLIIPSYNNRELLEKNLPSVLNCLRDGDELIIADDASQDETVSYLQGKLRLRKRAFQRLENKSFTYRNKRIPVTLLAHATNKRFAQNCNLAAAVASRPFLFFLNSDAEPLKPLLEPCLRHFSGEKAETVFAVACLEYETYTREQWHGKNILFFSRGLFRHRKADDKLPGPTAWASGGSMLVSAEKWRELGGFDTLFAPAYWEDIDLSVRARKQGWKVLFEPEAVLIHQHEESNQQAFGKLGMQQMSVKNALYFSWKHGSWRQKLAFLFWIPYYLTWDSQRLLYWRGLVHLTWQVISKKLR